MCQQFQGGSPSRTCGLICLLLCGTPSAVNAVNEALDHPAATPGNGGSVPGDRVTLWATLG